MSKKRVLLKLSGEALAGDKHQGFDEATVRGVVSQIKEVVKSGTEVAVIIGGGNFWRGRTSDNMDRVKADQIGMLATVMNCIYTADVCRSEGLDTVIMTPFTCGAMTEAFNKDKAIKALSESKVVFFAGGIGHPYFSTDMGTVLYAIEIGADIVLSGKSIDGVYDSDPNVNKDAKKYDKMMMKEIVDNKLGVIDLASAVLAMENHMPMLLFGLNEKDSIRRAVNGDSIGTYIEA